MGEMVRLALLCLALVLAVAAPAAAIVKLPAVPTPIAGNPADRLLAVPIEDSYYDPAQRCTPKAKPGMLALQRWLETNVSGVFWISAGNSDNARAHAIPKSGNLCSAGKACADNSDPYGLSVSHNRAPAC